MPKIEIHGIQLERTVNNIKRRIKEIFKDKPYCSDLRIEVYPTTETDCDEKEYSSFRLITSDPTKLPQTDKQLDRFKRDSELKKELSDNFPDMYIEHFYENDYVDSK